MYCLTCELLTAELELLETTYATARGHLKDVAATAQSPTATTARECKRKMPDWTAKWRGSNLNGTIANIARSVHPPADRTFGFPTSGSIFFPGDLPASIKSEHLTHTGLLRIYIFVSAPQ